MLKRKLFTSLIKHLDAKEVSVVVGPRQSGKTTLLNQLADFLRKKEESVIMLTLEDAAILSRLNIHPENLFDYVPTNDSKRTYILIDEIQYLANPSNFLKLIYDKHSPVLKLIVTGSSAFYIEKKFKDSLAGRKRIFELYTLSYDEFLDFRTGNNDLSAELNNMRSQHQYRPVMEVQIQSLFMEYLTYGGYPAVVVAPNLEDKVLLLQELLNSFVRRDILESNVSDPDRFYRLMLLLAHQTGSLVNMHELSLTLKLSVSAIENYMYILRKCFHVHLLKPFYSNVRKELIKMPKVFFHDLGMRNVLMNQFNQVFQRIDRGELAENYAFIRLRDKIEPKNLFFWRTAEGHEIDFIISRQAFEGEAIEIKYGDATYLPGKYKLFTTNYPGFPVSIRSIETEDTKRELIRL